MGIELVGTREDVVRLVSMSFLEARRVLWAAWPPQEWGGVGGLEGYFGGGIECQWGSHVP